MTQGRKIPLRTAWYGLIILASLLPALALSPWLSQQAHELLLQRAMLREELFHKEIETHLFLETDRLVSVLSNKSDPISYFLETGNHPGMLKTLIEKIIEREPVINTTTIYDIDANIIATTSRGHHTIADISTDQAAFAVPMLGRTFIGSPTRLKDDHFEFVITVPIKADHKVIGIMASTININEYWSSIRAKIPAHDSKIYLLDGRGSLLVHLSDTRHQQGDLLSDKAIVRSLLAGNDWHKSESYSGFEESEVFGIATLVRNLQWGIISEIPAKAIIPPIISALTTLTVIVVLLHVIFGLISLMFTRRLLNPISELAAAVRQAIDGNYTKRVSSSIYDEIHALTESFNRMIQEIENRESSLSKLSQAMEQAGDAILITDKTGIIEYVYPAFTEMTGFAREEAIGRSSNMLKSGRQDASFYQHMWKTILSGEKWEGMLTDQRKDGEHYPILMNIAPIYADDEITHFVAIQQDMSEQKLLEEQLRQAQKMESLGTLVGGIAHDFNNILAGMTGNLYLIKRQLRNQDEIRNRVEKIESLTYTAANMISQLLSFARKASVQMMPISLNKFLSESLPLACTGIPENIKLSTDICENELCIEGDTTQLQQMLINLLNNARDAVDGIAQAEISVNLCAFQTNATFTEQHPNLTAENYARLSVSDNGKGIDAKYFSLIFEPFFTTKDVGKGSGLGLAMAFGAMHTHGGTIEVESAPGSGSSFHLYFPILKKNIHHAPLEHTSERSGHGELILVVDDEAHVLETCREVLEFLDYKVVTARDGESGLEMFNQHSHEIALIITDIVMPLLGGVEMVEKIRQTTPDIPIIFTTGYDREQMLKNRKIEGATLLTKPIMIPELSQLIRRLLNTHQ